MKKKLVLNVLERAAALGLGILILWIVGWAMSNLTGFHPDSMDCGTGMNGRGYCGDGDDIVSAIGALMGVVFAFVGGIVGIAVVGCSILPAPKKNPEEAPSLPSE